MEIASWIIVGLVIGSLARVAMAGPAAGGLSVAILIGILGALTGGLLGRIFFPHVLAPFDFSALGMAAVGAMYPLFLYRCIAMRFDAPLRDVRREL